MSIESITDFAALRQLGDALWRRRATVLVGAGFSRNAQLVAADSPLPPLWNDLAWGMKHQLYADNIGRAPTDALRLADEYRTFFGRAALDDFIRAQVRDVLWTPAEIHKGFLELPWSDVLTTNYDTLIERAAQEVNERNYEIVRIESDFAHARAPRIVKLHGTIGVSSQFTITEEDYRKYPSEHAAFVNFARQSFLENELCLIGFSGDDPNFLQWTGWVRDHLGSSSRRIFLVGVLDLSASKRKYLEDKNIVPIDLADAVLAHEGGGKHSAAAEQFLSYLKGAKPVPLHDWHPQEKATQIATVDDHTRRYKDTAFAAALFKEETTSWAEDRTSYPGWLICPSAIRGQLRSFSNHAPWPTLKSVEKLSDGERSRFLYEFVWRVQASFAAIDSNLEDMFEAIADPDVRCELSKPQQLDIAVMLARWFRLTGSEARFNRWISVLEKHGADRPDIAGAAAYQRALWARDRSDLLGVEALLPKITGTDPAWALRRASLLCEVGELDKAEEIVTGVLADLRKRQRQDRNSLWIASRRAWASWFWHLLVRNRFRQPEHWSGEFREPKCDPFEIIEEVEKAIEKDVKKAREEAVAIRPQFSPGVFKPGGGSVQLGGSGTTPWLEFQRLLEDAGIPIRLDHINILGDMAFELMELSENESVDDWLRLIRFCWGTSGTAFERYFSRIKLALIPVGERDKIISALTGEIAYWRGKMVRLPAARMYAISRLQTLIEVLARFAAITSSEGAKKTYELALDLGRDTQLRHNWLFMPMANLMEYSVEAINPSDRPQLTLAALEFPTPGEAGLQHPMDWPTPSSWLREINSTRPADDPAWIARISKLIELVGGESSDRSESTFRLSHLVQRKLLTEAESTAFAGALWSKLDTKEPPLPAVDRMLLNALTWLPAPKGTDVRAALEARVFRETKAAENEDVLLALINLGEANNLFEAMLPQPAEAEQLFDALVQWRPRTFDSPLTEAFEGRNEKRKAEVVGLALGKVLVRALTSEKRTEVRLDALLAFIDAVNDGSALQGLPWIACALPNRRADIVALIKRYVLGPTYVEVNAGVVAIIQWLKAEKDNLPEEFASWLIASLEFRRTAGLTAVLMCLRKLVSAKQLTTGQLDRLNGPLSDLLDETAYERVEPMSVQAVSVSLVRKECLLLAYALRTVGIDTQTIHDWIAAATDDPLPEVRYAVEEG